VFGGTNGEALNVNEAYQPSLDNGNETPWETDAPLPDKRYGMGIASVADIIHIIGGDDAQNESTSLKYYPQSDTWEEFRVPKERTWRFLNLSSLGSYLFAMGGEIEGNLMATNASYQAIYTLTIPVVR
jgi:hypothetical protein